VQSCEKHAVGKAINLVYCPIIVIQRLGIRRILSTANRSLFSE